MKYQFLVSCLSSLVSGLPLQVPIQKVHDLPVVQIKVLRRSVRPAVSSAGDYPELVFAGEFRQDRLAVNTIAWEYCCHDIFPASPLQMMMVGRLAVSRTA